MISAARRPPSGAVDCAGSPSSFVRRVGCPWELATEDRWCERPPGAVRRWSWGGGSPHCRRGVRRARRQSAREGACIVPSPRRSMRDMLSMMALAFEGEPHQPRLLLPGATSLVDLPIDVAWSGSPERGFVACEWRGIGSWGLTLRASLRAGSAPGRRVPAGWCRGAPAASRRVRGRPTLPRGGGAAAARSDPPPSRGVRRPG